MRPRITDVTSCYTHTLIAELHIFPSETEISWLKVRLSYDLYLFNLNLSPLHSASAPPLSLSLSPQICTAGPFLRKHYSGFSLWGDTICCLWTVTLTLQHLERLYCWYLFFCAPWKQCLEWKKDYRYILLSQVCSFPVFVPESLCNDF